MATSRSATPRAVVTVAFRQPRRFVSSAGALLLAIVAASCGAAPAATGGGCESSLLMLTLGSRMQVREVSRGTETDVGPPLETDGLQLFRLSSADGVVLVALASPGARQTRIAKLSVSGGGWEVLAEGPRDPGGPSEALLAGDRVVARSDDGLLWSPLTSWQPHPYAALSGQTLIPIASGGSAVLLLRPTIQRFELLLLDAPSGATRSIAGVADRPGELAVLDEPGTSAAFARPSSANWVSEIVIWRQDQLSVIRVDGNVRGLDLSDDGPSYVVDRAGALELVTPVHKLSLGPSGTVYRATILRDRATGRVALGFFDVPEGRGIVVSPAGDIAKVVGIPVAWRPRC